jgi:hypothetical protein
MRGSSTALGILVVASITCGSVQAAPPQGEFSQRRKLTRCASNRPQPHHGCGPEWRSSRSARNTLL